MDKVSYRLYRSKNHFIIGIVYQTLVIDRLYQLFYRSIAQIVIGANYHY